MKHIWDVRLESRMFIKILRDRNNETVEENAQNVNHLAKWANQNFASISKCFVYWSHTCHTCAPTPLNYSPGYFFQTFMHAIFLT